MNQKSIGMTLLILNMFVGLTAVGGGVGLLTGGLQMPLEMLQGSPFTNYTLPGVVLAVVVGGSALVAAVLLLLRYKRWIIASILAGLFMMGFEVVEGAIVDRSAGNSLAIALVLQVIYFTLGLLIFSQAAYQWLAENRHPHLPPESA